MARDEPYDYHYASVTTTSPLTVKLDGSSTAIPAKQLPQVTALAVNDRVAVLHRDKEILVLGKPT